MTTDQKNLPALLEDIRTELTTAYNFKSTSPSAQECINCALDSLDQIAALARPEPASTPVAVEDEPSEIEEIISCLGDDAAMLIAENPDNEMAQTMLDAIVLIEKLSTEAVLLGMAQAAPTETQPVAVESNGAMDLLNELRQMGLAVAVHNDYRLNGEAHTFWLMTATSGMSYKGEGKTDHEALTRLAQSMAAPQGKQSAGAVEEVPYFIVFDDQDRKPELVIGAERAVIRFKQVSASWNAHLYVKVASNSRDCPYPNAAIKADPAQEAGDVNAAYFRGRVAGHDAALEEALKAVGDLQSKAFGHQNHERALGFQYSYDAIRELKSKGGAA